MHFVKNYKFLTIDVMKKWLFFKISKKFKLLCILKVQSPNFVKSYIVCAYILSSFTTIIK